MVEMTNEDTLRKKVQSAILELAPKFGITTQMLSTFKEPSLNINEGLDATVAFYYVHKVEIEAASVALDNPNILGEEVSHYLHHQLNPQLYWMMGFHGMETTKFWKGYELGELVADYGRLIHCNLKGCILVPIPVGGLINSREPGWASMMNDVAHELGYKRAEKAFMDYGDSILPRLARMSMEESIEELPRLLPVTMYERRILPKLDKIKILMRWYGSGQNHPNVNV